MCRILEDLEEGQVVWVNREKRYGFVKRVSNGEQIFFHLGDGRRVSIRDDGGMVFSAPLFTRESPDNLIPEKDDIIAFYVTKGKNNKPKACPWTYPAMIDNAWDQNEKENESCSLCGHLMGDHAGGAECMVSGCHCGDEDYDEDYESHIINVSDSPMGFHVCE